MKTRTKTTSKKEWVSPNAIRAERSEQEVSVKCTGCLISLTATSAALAPKESKQAAQVPD